MSGNLADDKIVGKQRTNGSSKLPSSSSPHFNATRWRRACVERAGLAGVAPPFLDLFAFPCSPSQTSAMLVRVASPPCAHVHQQRQLSSRPHVSHCMVALQHSEGQSKSLENESAACNSISVRVAPSNKLLPSNEMQCSQTQGRRKLTYLAACPAPSTFCSFRIYRVLLRSVVSLSHGAGGVDSVKACVRWLQC